MTKFVVIAVFFLSSAAYAQEVATKHDESTCSPFRPLAISYRPPIDTMLVAIKGLHPSTDDDIPLTKGDYRPSAVVVVSATLDGAVTASLSRSSGNRDVQQFIKPKPLHGSV